jgi:two-component system KDP operon response regulator KdpE
MSAVPNVFVVEDDDVTRRLLRSYFDARPEVTLAGVAEDAEGLRELIAGQIPDVVVLDLGLPDARGAALLLEIKAECPDSSVIVFSGTARAQAGAHLATMGADAYVEKPDIAGLHARIVELVR